MKSLIGTLTILSGFQQVTAHYYFNHLIANDTIFPRWRYVRPVLNETGLPDTQVLPWPMYDISSSDYRCGHNATGTGTMTEVATLVAGGKVGFRPSLYNVGRGMTAWHDGPLQAYLSRSPEQTPDGLKRWDGDGEYFKIAESRPEDPKGWFYDTYRSNNTVNTWNFTIPGTTPPGLYLLRAESVYPFTTFNRTQFYASCAQVEIIGPGGARTEPGPKVKFPGAFNHYHPGVWITEKVRNNLSLYEYPGPKVWTG